MSQVLAELIPLELLIAAAVQMAEQGAPLSTPVCATVPAVHTLTVADLLQLEPLAEKLAHREHTIVQAAAASVQSPRPTRGLYSRHHERLPSLPHPAAPAPRS